MITNDSVKQSIDYIMRHLDEEISIEDVANHCHYSKYYFSRIFKAETGESIYSFIKRLKMEQSALNLKYEREKTITEIGLDYGYSSSNYSSAFRKHHSISPAEFRKVINTSSAPNPFHPNKAARFHSFRDYDEHVQIKELEDFFVIYERHIGNYVEIADNWYRFIEKYNDYFSENTLLIERFYDDPTVSNVEQCLYDICMTVDKDCTFDNTTTIYGGKFAVYPFNGLIQEIFDALQGVFVIWLPESGYEMDKRYGLNIYKHISESMSVALDFCIPIK